MYWNIDVFKRIKLKQLPNLNYSHAKPLKLLLKMKRSEFSKKINNFDFKSYIKYLFGETDKVYDRNMDKIPRDYYCAQTINVLGYILKAVSENKPKNDYSDIMLDLIQCIQNFNYNPKFIAQLFSFDQIYLNFKKLQLGKNKMIKMTRKSVQEISNDQIAISNNQIAILKDERCQKRNL